MKEYESIEKKVDKLYIEKKVDKLLREKSEKKASEKNQEMKTCEEYKSEREMLGLLKMNASIVQKCSTKSIGQF